MSICKIQTPFGELEALVVKPRVAWALLQCSNTKGYQLIAAGELESFKDGHSRKITVKSIREYIARRLAPAKESNVEPPPPRKARADDPPPSHPRRRASMSAASSPK
jgi:hypothetical protein